MTPRRAPRPAAPAFRLAMERAAPRTRLAAVQSVWAAAVGGRIADVARPVAEKDGEVAIACADPVWAEELSLMQEQLLVRLREQLGEQAPESLRFRVEDAAS